MPDDPEIQQRTARLVTRFGARAPGFATMVARQLEELGDARRSAIWDAIAVTSASLLEALSPRHARLAAKSYH